MDIPAPSTPPATRSLPPIEHGSARDVQRSRELYKYYQPPPPAVQPPRSVCVAADNICTPQKALVSSLDPALSSFTLLTANLLSCKRSMISLIDSEMIYVIAESTRTLSITSPHTCEPGDQLWLGGCTSIPREGGLCERTVSLLASEEMASGNDGVLVFEVPDLRLEPFYKHDDCVVNWPHMTFYAGTPLRSRNGLSIGSLCVLDDKPHPEGLRESDKMTLAKMAETVMAHLERVQAERDMKRGRNMELGISRFLAGNFRLGRAELDDEMVSDRRRVEEKKKEKKSMEAERLRWVDQIGKSERGNNIRGAIMAEEEDKTTKRSNRSTHDSRRRKESDPFARDFATGLDQDFINAEDSWHETNEMGLASVKTSQLPLSFPSPVSEDFESTLYTDAPLYLADPVSIPELSRKFSYASVKTGRVASGPKTGSITSGSSLSNTIPPSSPSDSLFHDSDFVPHFSAATTPTGQLQATPSDINSAFRSTFARASVLIRKSIEVDGVVFVDADLEDTYDDEYAETPEDISSQCLGVDAEFTSIPQRPKKYRRRSGILGFATKSGSSCLNPFNSGSMMCRRGSELERTLGFDIGEIDESFLHHLATRWSQGRVFSCSHTRNNSDAALSDSEGEGSIFEGKYCDEVETLKRFLPGVRSAVIMPLYDFSGKLFAVGFTWSCSKTRVFSEDVEKNYMAAFGNSIMAEVGRLHCVSADKAKGDFISSVSHELRSPLHGILASAEFLADTNLDSFQRSFVDTVESCGRTLLDTINHVLDFSKLNSFGNKWAGTRSSSKKESVERRRMSRQRGRSGSVSSLSQSGSKSDEEEFERKPSTADNLPGPVNDVVHLTAETDLSAILEEVTEGVFAGYEFKGISTPGIMEVVGKPKVGVDGRPAAGAKNDITVIIDIDQHEDGWVFETQPGALRRIFLNLGGNAIKYTDSGWVRIRMKVQDLPRYGNEVDRRSLVKLIFTDSGKGISREFLKTRLFTPFSQENPLVSGTGLGMSIVRQIVEMLGGEIDVKSQLGKGTEVTVSLVLKRGAKARPAQTPSGEEVCEKDTEVEDLRKRTKGKKVCLCGFETSPPESESQIRAVTYMKNSFERYVTQWLGMEVVSHSLDSADADKVDFVITHEGPAVNSHLSCTKKGKGIAGKAGGPPLVVICSNAARHEIYQPLNSSESRGIVDFVSKPCGPRKLAKALASCLDRIEAASKAPVATEPTVLAEADVGAPQQPCVGENTTVHISKSTRFLPLTGGEITTTTTTTTSVVSFPTKKVSDDASVVTAITPTPVIPRPLSQPAEVDNPIAQWKQEVERISSLNVSEPNRKLPSTLIVEDNPVNLMLLATFLKKKGYPFEKATNGLEAFQAVEKRPEAFDIILMDLQMPVMSGIESTRAIRRLERQRKRKGSLIIALTGLATANDQLEAFEGGIDLFMVKPVSFKHLEKTLKEFKLEDQD